MSIADKLTIIAENEQKVYDAGKKSQYDKFWDTYQDNGNRTDYAYAFKMPWSEEHWIPKYDIKPTTAVNIFVGVQVVDLVEHQAKHNFVIDFSMCTNLQQMGSGNRSIERFGVVDTRSASSLVAPLNSIWSLKKVDEFILKEDGSQTFSYPPFGGCNKLTDLTIKGKIGNTVSFADNKALTDESLKGEYGIINALLDLTGTGKTATITLHADAKAKLSDSDKATITQKGWTIA